MCCSPWWCVCVWAYTCALAFQPSKWESVCVCESVDNWCVPQWCVCYQSLWKENACMDARVCVCACVCVCVCMCVHLCACAVPFEWWQLWVGLWEVKGTERMRTGDVLTGRTSVFFFTLWKRDNNPRVREQWTLDTAANTEISCLNM